MNADKIGRIVWHDLFTSDLDSSINFYGRVASWAFTKERTNNFVWGQGKGEFTLAHLNGEAGTGLTKTAQNLGVGWFPYVEVPNVDGFSKRAEKMGAQIVRPPFDVAGVGRNCLLLDPLGARFGISVSQHDYPIPTQQFAAEIYLTEGSEFPAEFYQVLFDWDCSRTVDREVGVPTLENSHTLLELVVPSEVEMCGRGVWIPAIKVAAIENAASEALRLGASQISVRPQQVADQAPRVFSDPLGCLFAVQ